MRLDDLVVLNPNIEGDYYPVTRAEVLQAALTEECPRCGGTGIDTLTPYRTFDGDCDHCEGRGWLPSAHATYAYGGVYGLTEDDCIVVPLSMLEGDDQ